jgi:hypothetical protein
VAGIEWLSLNRIWIVGRETLEVKKFRAGKADCASDCTTYNQQLVGWGTRSGNDGCVVVLWMSVRGNCLDVLIIRRSAILRCLGHPGCRLAAVGLQTSKSGLLYTKENQ